MHFFDADGHMGWLAMGWLLAFILLLMLFRKVVNHKRRRGDSNSPESILARQFAAGEIDAETYERMRGEVDRAKRS